MDLFNPQALEHAIERSRAGVEDPDRQIAAELRNITMLLLELVKEIHRRPNPS